MVPLFGKLILENHVVSLPVLMVPVLMVLIHHGLERDALKFVKKSGQTELIQMQETGEHSMKNGRMKFVDQEILLILF